MRELMKALSDFETQLMENHGVTLNEAMTLCAVGDECITASVISERTGLRPSHTSKVVSSLESKKYVIRKLGKQDKRQMYLSLSTRGKECLSRIKVHAFDIPPMLQPILQEYQQSKVEGL